MSFAQKDFKSSCFREHISSDTINILPAQNQ